MDARKDSLQKLLERLPEMHRTHIRVTRDNYGQGNMLFADELSAYIACADLLAAETARADAAELRVRRLEGHASATAAACADLEGERDKAWRHIALLRAECRASRQSDFEDGNDLVEIQMMLGTALAAARVAVDEAGALEAGSPPIRGEGA